MEIEKKKELETDRRNKELEHEIQRLSIEAENTKADMELNKNLDELKMKMDLDFKLQELRLQHKKQSFPEEIPKDSSTLTQEGKTNHQTRIRIPVNKENVNDLEIWLDRYELVCTMENLDKKLWGTKLVEFLQGGSP